MTNQTTFPSYGYFLKQGFTTWPENWRAGNGVSKMHGCYNAIGLWFIQGVAGITVAADSPLRIKAGIESGDLVWAQGSHTSIHGQVHSSWSVSVNGFSHNITIPVNALARVLIPGNSENAVMESGISVKSAKGVDYVGMQQLNLVKYVVLKVGSGHYQFTSNWTRPSHSFSFQSNFKHFHSNSERLSTTNIEMFCAHRPSITSQHIYILCVCIIIIYL
eukprot:TRINITY_DN4390_c2_g1_i1.p1 TRINITY_DN4390_c2_g1~~TRINITY_DN4390_c2_g1_i1.p1  ORF type:complete len:218 (+),score=-1.40 TRINITY_DN4390_c2_g1_i1:138-791(+)